MSKEVVKGCMGINGKNNRVFECLSLYGTTKIIGTHGIRRNGPVYSSLSILGTTEVSEI